MNTAKPHFSIGDIDKESIIRRAERKVSRTNTDPYYQNVQIEVMIEREMDQVFKKDFMGSSTDLLHLGDSGAAIGYLVIVFILLITSDNSLLQFSFLVVVTIVLLIAVHGTMKERIESAFKSGSHSGWHLYEPEYRDALWEIRQHRDALWEIEKRQRKENTKPKRGH